LLNCDSFNQKRHLKKRILYIARNIPSPNQNENNVILNIAKKLSSEFEIDILYPKEIVPWGLHFYKKYKPLYNLQPWEWNGKTIQILKYVRLPNNANAFLFGSKYSNIEKIKFDDYDFIHGHFIFPDGIFTLELAIKWSLPYFITIRESDLDLLRKVSKTSSTWNWATKILKGATKIHVLNNASTNFTKEHFNLDTVLIPHGIGSSNIQENNHDNNSSEIKISVIGAANPGKQIDWVVKAVMEYQGAKKTQLNVIGDGPQLNELKGMANQVPSINFLGKIPHADVFKYLTASDIFALPSRKESFGLVYLEAAATGNAIIGYKNTGIYGVLEEGKEIIYIDNYVDFKNALFNLIENGEQRKVMQKNAKDKAKELTWDKVIERYSKLYKEW